MTLLWRTADGPAAVRALAAADLRWLLLAFVALTLQTVLSALRWRLTAGQLGIALGRGQAVGEYYLSQIVNQSLPGGMLGDASRAVRSRDQAGLLAAGQAVVFERLAGQIALFVTLAVAFALTWMVPGGLAWPRWLAVPVGVFLLCGLLTGVLFSAADRLPGALGRGALSVRDAFRQSVLAPQVLRRQVLLSVATTICNLAAFAFCAAAVGLHLGFAVSAALVPLVLFAMLIPLSVSGWGLREGAAAAFLPVAGASASDALAASIAFGLTFLAAVVPGLLVFLRRSKTHAGENPPADRDSDTPGGTIRRA